MAALTVDESPPSRRANQVPLVDSINPTAKLDADEKVMGRTTSTSSTKVDPATPSRSSTLKKKASLRKRGSLSRRGSMKSLRSMKGATDVDDNGFNSVFHTPIPTQGNPTEVLANRFQAWRKLLKDLITYFREIQASYEVRSKALLKVSNVVNNAQTPAMFLTQGGLDDALVTLRNFHKISLVEANKSRDIEDDVITQLNGLRSDLNQKIKEIKSLSGDFKNSVDKEKDATRRTVDHYKDTLAAAEANPASASGKSDPFIVRLAVDRQVEKQIEEENYLHRAYLNLEGSGRELESIVVGEIQKACNAYVGILRRESDHAHDTIDELRAGPIAMPKDQEWIHFVEHDDHFVNPNMPLRRLEEIYYPGKFDPAAAEIRAGMLERKSKYLKSYTPGWYVLSPTHLHEFKSADHIHTQQPVMSLYLLEQKLGSHSQPGASSHKFSLKGRQTGTMHRGHAWVFRAETYDTMMAWFEDIRALTEKTGAEKSAFVRRHARSVSGESHRAVSVSSDGLEEEDAEPFAANVARQEALTSLSKRPSPGGRFPSDLNLNRHIHAPLSPSSGGSVDIANEQGSNNGPSSSNDAPIQSVLLPAAAVAASPHELLTSKIHSPAQQAQANDHVLHQQAQLLPQQKQAVVFKTNEPVTRIDDYIPAVTAAGGAYKAYAKDSTPESAMPIVARAAEPELQSVTMETSQSLQSVVDAREPTLPIIGGTYAHEQEPTTFLAPARPSVDASSITTTVATETGLSHDLPAGMHATGQLFPSVIRHDTSMSISKLHVPGEFPPPPSAE